MNESIARPVVIVLMVICIIAGMAFMYVVVGGPCHITLNDTTLDLEEQTNTTELCMRALDQSVKENEGGG